MHSSKECEKLHIASDEDILGGMAHFVLDSRGELGVARVSVRSLQAERPRTDKRGVAHRTIADAVMK